MHYEPRGLVYEQDVLILEYYGDGGLLRREPLLGKVRLDALSAPHFERRRDGFTLDEQEIVLDQPLHEAPAHPETLGGQPVETFSGLSRVYVEALRQHPATSGARRGAGPYYSRRRRKRLALKMRLSDCSLSSLSKNACELLSSASDGSSCSTSFAASGSDTGGSWAVSSCAVDGSTSGSATSGASAEGSSVTGSAARGPLPSVRITSVCCSSAAGPPSLTSGSSSAGSMGWVAPGSSASVVSTKAPGSSPGSTISCPEIVSSHSSLPSGTAPASAAAIASSATIASSADVISSSAMASSMAIASSAAMASSWAASRTTAIDSVSRRSRRDASISLAEATSMLSIMTVK